MTFDIISKHGLIIGFVSILVHVPVLILEVPHIKYNIEETDCHGGEELKHVLFSLYKILIALISIIVCIILICGILQKKSWLLVPWLLLELFYSFVLAADYSRGFKDIAFYAYFVAFQALLFFPICYLFVAIRRKNAAACVAAKFKH